VSDGGVSWNRNVGHGMEFSLSRTASSDESKIQRGRGFLFPMKLSLFGSVAIAKDDARRIG
jgi:hypothetical protein